MLSQKENLLYLTSIDLKLVESAGINKNLSALSLFFLFWKDFPTAAHYTCLNAPLSVSYISERYEQNINRNHELSLSAKMYRWFASPPYWWTKQKKICSQSFHKNGR